MSIHVYSDHIDGMSIEEVNGVIRKLQRLVRVKASKAFPTVSPDYRAMKQILDEPTVPQPNTTLTQAGLEHLTLVKRSARIPPNTDNKTFDVVCDYEHILDGPNQNLFNGNALLGGTIYGKTRCSVQQKTTNFYKKDGNGPQTQILTRHTYPLTDENFPGKTHIAGGEVTVYQAHRNFNFQGYRNTNAPWLLADNLIGAINRGSWMNHGETEWMCTEVEWYMEKQGRYRFAFEFQHNPDGWNPTVVFIDRITQRPPPGLMPGEGRGYWTVLYHKRINFNAQFNAFFESWAQLLGGLLF